MTGSELGTQGAGTPTEVPGEARVKRTTGETQVEACFRLKRSRKPLVSTGVGFFDHLLTAFAVHGLFDLELRAEGDLEVDAHHLVEDVGLTLGKAVAAATGDKKGLARFGSCILPMDDALVLAAVDLSGRPFCRWDFPLEPRSFGLFHTDLAGEFFRALAAEAGLTLHIRLLDGTDAHHCLEAAFKAAGRALDQATRTDPGVDDILSTKGVL